MIYGEAASRRFTGVVRSRRLTVTDPTPAPKRYHLNVVGDFYVEDRCCTWCGIPGLAPNLFEADNKSHEQCFVKKQPATPDEITQMIDVMHQQELGCIHYAGRDPKLLEALASVSYYDHCDEMVRDADLRRDILARVKPVEGSAEGTTS